MSKFKPFMLPSAILIGGIFYALFAKLAFLSPYVIFFILFFTYCRIDFKDLQFTRLHFVLLGVQMVISLLLYVTICRFNLTLAQGLMICIFVPTAMSAPAVTGMLGGNVAFVATYNLLTNTVVAVVAPLVFPLMGGLNELSFGVLFIEICNKVIPLLVAPFLLAILVRRYLPILNDQICKFPMLTFYLWNLGLMLVIGRTVYFMLHQEAKVYHEEFLLAVGALLVCSVQFLIGKRVGTPHHERVAAGQSLGQKNTILAIWMAQSYFNPLSSIGPAAYVLWQNLINSYQMWKYKKEEE